jgi:hypothetical protein
MQAMHRSRAVGRRWLILAQEIEMSESMKVIA